MGTRSLKQAATRTKRVALYARVSTEEQTKGLYPSCESQIEELESYCASKGWEAYEAIKDEGYSAGSLKRPGLSRLRWLVETDQIEGVVCTWYDRFTRSRDFYIVDREFKNHDVDFTTLHDRADRATASGRFMEMMLVAAKTYDREQTGEKVRDKLRMRKEKNMWNGGLVSFGFYKSESHNLHPVEELRELIQQIFQIYIDTASDHAVRDWLKAHHIKSPSGTPVWTTSTIRDLLCNRRYAGEIEINADRKGAADSSEKNAYRIVKAPYEPIVSVETFERAQKIRAEKADRYPHHRGSSRSVSQNRDNRVYLLQGIGSCAECGHPMSPHYVFKKAGYGRRKDSTIHHYVCARYKKYGTDCDHKNRVLAGTAEEWVLERIHDLIQSRSVIERVLEKARERFETQVSPQRAGLARIQAALRENQTEIDKIVATVTSGQVADALLGFLNRRAQELQIERENLLKEGRALEAIVAPGSDERLFDAAAFRQRLGNWDKVREAAKPEETQRVIRSAIKNVAWSATGAHKMTFYMPALEKACQENKKSNRFSLIPAQNGGQENRFDFDRRRDASGRGRTDTSEETGF